MVRQAVITILFGALLFVLGMMPGLLIAFRDGLRNIRNQIAQGRAPVEEFPTDSRVSGEVWLIVGGGALMILELVALLLK